MIRPDAYQPFDCSVARAVAVLVARGDWPQNRTLSREEAAADFYVMAAHQVLWDCEPQFGLVVDRYLGE